MECLLWIQHLIASIPLIIYVISYNIGPRYNGTPRYSVGYNYLSMPEMPAFVTKVLHIIWSVAAEVFFLGLIEAYCSCNDYVPKGNAYYNTSCKLV